MKEVSLQSWEEFEQNISLSLQEMETKRREARIYISRPLFRGHGNASWKLETTLERFTPNQCKTDDYYRIIRAIKPAVESLTEKSWDLPNEYTTDDSTAHAPPGYEFMVYLRHHGFPSPLLDWSRSPYVAAFFAFRSKEPTKDGNVAVDSYVEYSGGGKGWTDINATVFGLGPYIATHRRHHIQQCEYTVCRKRVDKEYFYCSHEEAFARNDRGQDKITKYILPLSERAKVLEKLDAMNINSYSLFGNEEGLMEVLAYREIERLLR